MVQIVLKDINKFIPEKNVPNVNSAAGVLLTQAILPCIPRLI